MNCQALINKFLYDYHAGTLSLPRRVEFELHLKLCSACRKYLASYRKTVELGKRIPLEPPPDAPRELIEAILSMTLSKE